MFRNLSYLPVSSASPVLSLLLCHISSERIEKEVVEYTKRLVHNEKFVDYVKMKIGKSIDVTEIENELASYDKKLKALERNKKSLEKDIDSLLDFILFIQLYL